jgi:hypothetical protein
MLAVLAAVCLQQGTPQSVYRDRFSGVPTVASEELEHSPPGLFDGLNTS